MRRLVFCVLVFACCGASAQTVHPFAVSLNAAGTATANSESNQPSVSANGRFVAFTSASNDMVNNDANSVVDVFVRDLQSGTTELVSLPPAGVLSNGNSFGPVISADGRFVVFRSQATN